MKLYSWQRSCIKKWKENGYRGIVNVVTGAGKTVFALAAMDDLAASLPDLQVRIVVPTIPLARQWQEALMRHVQTEEWRPGFFGGGIKDEPSRRVMIYIINSARDTLAGHIRRDLSLDKNVLLICDECHHCQSKENRKIFSFLDNIGSRVNLYHCIGLSATPFGTPCDSILTASLGKEIFRYDYNQAVTEGIISSFTVCEVSASFQPREMAEYCKLSDAISVQLARLLRARPGLKNLSKTSFMKEVTRIAREADMDPSEPAAAFLIATFQRKKLTNLALARTECALAILEQLRSSDRVLIFCERIEQVVSTVSSIRKKMGNCTGIYHSEMTKEARKREMESFRSGSTRILVSCRCLDEGIDVPEANIAIVMSSSAISRQRIQRLGRVIRRAEGKDAACLYYIYIRESSDDAAYLENLEECETFCLRYYTGENVFSNELYEYAAATLLKNARKARLTQPGLEEMRRCITQGLVRADFLLPDKVQEKNRRAAENVHERNYWTVMKKIGQAFHEE